jgi:3D (Asp-Asp-Asp) domain-containing protein
MCSDGRQSRPTANQRRTCAFLHEEAYPSCATVVRSCPVLGQAHTPRRRLVPLAALALAVLAAPAMGGANPSQSASTLRAQDAAIAAKSRAAVLGLYSLDQRLGAARTKLAALQQQAHALRAQRASLAHQLNVAKHGTQVSQRRLAERLRVLYEQGNVEPLEVVFGATSLDEALTNLDNLNRVAGQGEDVLRELTQARGALRSATRTLAARQAALLAATREARATADALANARAARDAYILSLAAQRRLTQSQITAVVSRAHAAQLRSVELVRARAAAAPLTPVAAVSFSTAPASSAALGGRAITVSATGYSLPGSTASGLPVGWGVVAVDPSVIPLGTHMTIPGYGEAVAADTGGAIVGSTIDLWFPSTAQASAWGRRTVTIVVH